MPSQFRRYTKCLISSSLALLALVGAFNWLVDPYGIYNSPKIEGFNALKPEFGTHLRMSKAYAARAAKPKTIILGSSRAERGVDPSYAGWEYAPVYNLGLDGAHIYEILRYFQHCNNIQPLKQVLLTLDFFSFATDKRNEADFAEGRLSVDYNSRRSPFFISDFLATLLSADALISSSDTIRNQNGDVRYLDNGMYKFAEADIRNIGGNRAYFLLTAKEYATELYLPEMYQFDNLNSDYNPFTYFRGILRIAYAAGIDLRMAISPCHVRQWEVLADAGLWPKFEEWKRSLVVLNEEEARHFGKAPCPLWDFSVYDELTTETVPALGDTKTIMRWYWDSSHYRRELGDLMLDRIFGFHVPGRVVPDDFGVLLSSENIDGHLQKTRADHQHYRDTHSDDIAEIDKLFK